MFKKNSNGNVPKTPSEIHMYDMVKIETIVFEIVGRGAFKAPPPWIVSCLKYPGSDRDSDMARNINCQLWPLYF